MSWILTKIEEPNAITADYLEDLSIDKNLYIYPINKISAFGDEWSAINLNTIPYVSNKGQIIHVPWKQGTFDFDNIGFLITSEDGTNVTSKFVMEPLGYDSDRDMLAIYMLPNRKRMLSPQVINIEVHENVEQGEK